MSLGHAFGLAFAGILGAFYADGTLHRRSRTEGYGGSFFAAFTGDPGQDEATPIKVQVDKATEAMRGAEGFTMRDVALIVLQSSPAAIAPAPTTDDQITTAGIRYAIVGPVEADPAGAAWLIHARPAA